MEIVEIIIIALGLAMDAFAVSVANGMITTKHSRNSDALKMATFFGSFQAFMPIIGWAIGLGLIDFISGFDHWVAFGLLGFIGCKMIYEAIRKVKEEKKVKTLSVHVLLILAIATSIDALAVGISFAFLKIASIAIPAIIIGVVTFLLSFFGASTGNKLGEVFGKKIEIVGGLILIGIGLKILIEHLV
ncbi:MAG: manganese efflux pump MntP family protein [Candidatus Bathyarchaeota archaeon]|jgi:putative Mn2+ efflux pump MntP|nr:manganese efflux pump [Candidatus Bathyarchaeota archaeon A05DMB-5]MDH7558267.1 manganese efflux pump MntP family protein [Candidatus Bathyarchaeota archaeon]